MPDTMTLPDKPTARDLGWEAGKIGVPSSANPFPISIAGHRLWQEMWELAQRDRCEVVPGWTLEEILQREG